MQLARGEWEMQSSICGLLELSEKLCTIPLAPYSMHTYGIGLRIALREVYHRRLRGIPRW